MRIRPMTWFGIVLTGLMACAWMAKNFTSQSSVRPPSLAENRFSDSTSPKGGPLTRIINSRTSSADSAAEDWRDAFQNLFERDVRGALEWLGKTCANENRAEAIANLTRHWMGKNPVEAIAGASQIENKILRHEYIQALAAHFELTLELAREITISLGAGDQDVLGIWITSVVGRWGASELPNILEWANNSERPVQGMILNSALPIWAKSDPQAAAKFCDSSNINIQFDVKRRIGVEWAAINGAEALKWVSQLSDPFQREVAIRTALASFAKTHPIEAAEYALKLPTQKEQVDACIDIASTWAKEDIKSAAAWAIRFPPGQAHDKAVFAVFREYSKQDLKATGDWLYHLPRGLGRDQAMGEYVQELENQFPSTAVEWASQIDNEQERARRLKNALEAWSRTDPQEAEKWKRSR